MVSEKRVERFFSAMLAGFSFNSRSGLRSYFMGKPIRVVNDEEIQPRTEAIISTGSQSQVE